MYGMVSYACISHVLVANRITYILCNWLLRICVDGACFPHTILSHTTHSYLPCPKSSGNLVSDLDDEEILRQTPIIQNSVSMAHFGIETSIRIRTRVLMDPIMNKYYLRLR